MSLDTTVSYNTDELLENIPQLRADIKYNLYRYIIGIVEGENARFVMVNFEHDEQYTAVEPAIAELIKNSDKLILEYYYRALLGNATGVFKMAMEDIESGKIQNPRLQASKLISELSESLQKDIFTADPADSPKFELAYQATKFIPFIWYLCVASLSSSIENAEIYKLPLITMAFAMMTVYFDALIKFSLKQGAYNPSYISPGELMTFDLDLVRRVDLAKGIMEIDANLEPKANGEKYLITVLYPRAHLIRAMEYISNAMNFGKGEQWFMNYFELIKEIFGLDGTLKSWRAPNYENEQ